MVHQKGFRRRARDHDSTPISEEPAKKKGWEWWCRLDRGIDVIDTFTTSISKTARANFERARDQLSQLEITEWSKPNPASYIKKNHIYVIRFQDEASKKWRIFGHADVDAKRFILSHVAYEQNYVYLPKGSPNWAAAFQKLAAADLTQHAHQCFKPIVAAETS
ncbi:hypothetical protein [Rhodanobacter sp. L36]|uniref:hypothetical protein n=1 Tax=Rhodanobacter sp. L36 TaxID=1747221 RepID=UPI00131AF2F7|nr:hypothetical protein [Rhodanobacter sp. L36]